LLTRSHRETDGLAERVSIGSAARRLHDAATSADMDLRQWRLVAANDTSADATRTDATCPRHQRW
jgi:hypothetical protein